MVIQRNNCKSLVAHALIVTVFFLLFFAASLVCSEGSHATEKVCKVTASKLNVRSDAGTDYKVVGTLKKGTYRVVQSSKKGSDKKTWYKVSVKSKTGYVRSDYAPLVEVKVYSVSDLKGKVNIKSGSLFARSGPGSIYKTLGKLAKDKTFKITGKAKDVNGVWWYKMTLEGKAAYVCSSYVKTSSTKPAATTTKAKTTTKTTTKATTKKATTTKATTTKAATTQATTKPTTTEALSYKVTPLKNLSGKVSVKSGSLFVRSGPATTFKSLGALKKGKTFKITGKTKIAGTIWYRLTYKKKTGYVHSSYVKTSSTTTAGTTTAASQTDPSDPEETTQPTTTAEDYARTLKARKAACDWAVKIAKDNTFHYGKSKWAHHNGCYFCGTNQAKNSIKRKAGGSLAQVSKTYCCNPFVTAAYCHGAGAPEVDCKTKGMRVGLANDTNKLFKNTLAWERVAKPKKATELEPGDILLTPTHAMLYIGDGKVAHAAHHDNGKKGAYWNDSIKVNKISKNSWKRTKKIYRYLGTGKF